MPKLDNKGNTMFKDTNEQYDGRKSPTDGLRWYGGKTLVSFFRGGDAPYAHAGEKEAIEIAMQGVEADQAQRILDVGCGLGGTAAVLQQWGHVDGFDIEEASVLSARERYPLIDFRVSDVVNAAECYPGQTFDIITLFNVFYAFPQQEAALLALRKIAHPGTKLILFDYSAPENGDSEMICYEPVEKTFNPIRPESIVALLEKTGWTNAQVRPLDREYEAWYATFLEKIASKESAAREEFGDEAFDHAQKRYQFLYDEIVRQNIGGVLVSTVADACFELSIHALGSKK